MAASATSPEGFIFPAMLKRIPWQCQEPTVSGNHPLGEALRPEFLADFTLVDNLNGVL
jgi:hypothetical protein